MDAAARAKEKEFETVEGTPGQANALCQQSTHVWNREEDTLMASTEESRLIVNLIKESKLVKEGW